MWPYMQLKFMVLLQKGRRKYKDRIREINYKVYIASPFRKGLN